MKRIVCGLAFLMALLFALTGCAALTNASQLAEYEMSSDRIPSITSVVGEREVTGANTGIDNGVATKEYTYVSATVYDDLWAYVQKLMGDGWLVTQDIDLAVVPGSGQLGTHSIEEGQILLLSFSYDDAGYVIEIVKGEGTLE